MTPELFNLLQRLEPFGVGNPQPVFAARSVRLMASPRIMKDKHVKLKVAPAVGSLLRGPDKDAPDLAILTTPRCDPDSAALRRSEVREATNNRQETDSKWRQNITFDALGWHMAERCQQAGLLPGDALDIAFTIDNNDHPEYGGLELSLRDFTSPEKAADKIRQQSKRKLRLGCESVRNQPGTYSRVSWCVNSRSTREESMRGFRLKIVVVLFLVTVAGAQNEPGNHPEKFQPAPAASDSSSRLPVKRVVLYKNGIGYFEHTARVHGTQDLAIDFTTTQLNDVLKSLTVVDLGEGRISGVRYNSVAPLDERLKALRLPLENK